MSKSKKSGTSLTSGMPLSAVEKARENFLCRSEIKDLIKLLRSKAEKSDYSLIEVADVFNDLRRDFEAEQASLGCTWYEWGRDNLGFGKNRMALVQRLADAKDRKAQERMLDLFRGKQNEDQHNSRERKRKKEQREKAEIANLGKERQRLIAWARSARHKDVLKVWAIVQQTYPEK